MHFAAIAFSNFYCIWNLLELTRNFKKIRNILTCNIIKITNTTRNCNFYSVITSTLQDIFEFKTPFNDFLAPTIGISKKKLIG